MEADVRVRERGRRAAILVVGCTLMGLGACAPQWTPARHVPTVPTADQDEVGAAHAFLRSIQSCFAQAQPLPVGGAGYEVFPAVAPGYGTYATFSPRGDTFVVVGEGVHLYGEEGRHLGSLSSGDLWQGEGSPGRLEKVLYGADGSELLVWTSFGTEGTAKPAVVVDVRAGKVAARCELAPEPSLMVASPGGRHGYLHPGVIVDGDSGATTPLPGVLGSIAAVFSADGSKLMATTISGTQAGAPSALVVYGLDGKQLVHQPIQRVGGLLNPLGVSSDGNTLLYGDTGSLHLVHGGQEVRTLAGLPGLVAAGLSSRGDRLISMLPLETPPPPNEPFAPDRQLALVNVATGTRRHFVSAEYAGVIERDEGRIALTATRASWGWLSRDDWTKPPVWVPPYAPPPPSTQKSAPAFRIDLATQEVGTPGWRFPVLIAQDEQGRERFRRPIPSPLPRIVVQGPQVLIVRVSGIYTLDSTAQARYEAGQLPREESGDAPTTEYLLLLDPASGEQRAIVQIDDAVVWSKDELLVATRSGDRLCVQLLATRTLKEMGSPQCTEEVAWPEWIKAIERQAESLAIESLAASLRASAAAMKNAHRVGLAKHSAAKQAVIFESFGSAYLFDGKRFEPVWRGEGGPGTTLNGVVIAGRRNEMFLTFGERVIGVNLADRSTRSIASSTSFAKPMLAANETRLLVSGTSRDVSIFDVDSGARVARWFLYAPDQWVLLGEDGTFAASEHGADYLSIRAGGAVHALGQYAEKLYRPDVIFARLQGAQVQDAPTVNLATLVTRNPPELEWLGESSGVLRQRDVTLGVRVRVRDGGLGRIEWRLNGMTIGSSSDNRGLKLQSEHLDVKKLLTLAPGPNRIEVIAFDQSGEVASSPIVAEFRLEDAISERPALHVLAVGVNAYRDRALQLKYAVPDAEALASALQASAGSVFERVQVTMLTDAMVTREGLQQAFSKVAGSVKSHDVFVFYLAGHGVTLDGRYHFVPVDLRYRNEDSVRQEGVTHDHLRDWLAQVPALKSLVLLDTCNSGSFTSAAVSTRGMAEKTAIDKLTRATGRATIAASSENQVAIEGHEGHGVFTWVLMQAMRLADKNGDGVLSTTELASYIDEGVPKITYERWGYEQVPQVSMQGREFPIGVVQRF